MTDTDKTPAPATQAPALWDGALEEARSLIGVDLRRTHQTWNTEASPDAVRQFCWGIGDDNPLWTDAAYAEKTRYGTLIAWAQQLDLDDDPTDDDEHHDVEQRVEQRQHGGQVGAGDVQQDFVGLLGERVGCRTGSNAGSQQVGARTQQAWTLSKVRIPLQARPRPCPEWHLAPTPTHRQIVREAELQGQAPTSTHPGPAHLAPAPQQSDPSCWAPPQQTQSPAGLQGRAAMAAVGYPGVPQAARSPACCASQPAAPPTTPRRT